MKKMIFLLTLLISAFIVHGQVQFENGALCAVNVTSYCFDATTCALMPTSGPITVLAGTIKALPGCSSGFTVLKVCWATAPCDTICTMVTNMPATPTSCFPNTTQLYPPCSPCGVAQVVWDNLRKEFFMHN